MPAARIQTRCLERFAAMGRSYGDFHPENRTILRPPTDGRQSDIQPHAQAGTHGLAKTIPPGVQF